MQGKVAGRHGVQENKELSEVYHKTIKVGMRKLGTGAGSKHRA